MILTIWRVQFCSVAQSCPTLCDPMDCSKPGFLVHHQLPELAQIHVHQVGDAIQPSHPLLSLSPPAFNLSQSILHIRWPKYWSFSFNISPSNEYSGLISFRIDGFDLLAIQGTLKSLLQHHSSSMLIFILWTLYFEEYWLEECFGMKVFPWDLYFQVIQVGITNEEHFKENQGGRSWALKAQDGLLYKTLTESLDTSAVSQEVCKLNVGFPKSLWL